MREEECTKRARANGASGRGRERLGSVYKMKKETARKRWCEAVREYAKGRPGAREMKRTRGAGRDRGACKMENNS